MIYNVVVNVEWDNHNQSEFPVSDCGKNFWLRGHICYRGGSNRVMLAVISREDVARRVAAALERGGVPAEFATQAECDVTTLDILREWSLENLRQVTVP